MFDTAIETLPQPQFGIRLRTIRQDKGISQAQLAGPGMSTAYLSRLESGSRPPTERVVAYLCEKLGLPASSFQTERTDRTAEALAMALSGDTEEALGLLLDTVRQPVTANPALRWQALWMLAEQQRKEGDREDERATLEALTELSDQIRHPSFQARSRVQLARCQRAFGDSDLAHLTAAEAHAIAAEHRLPPSDLTRALLVLISVEAETDHLDQAVAHTDQVLRAAEHLPHTLRAEALWTAGSIRARQGRLPEATGLLEQAITLLGTGNDELLLWTRLRLAAAALHLRATRPDTAQALRHLTEAGPAVQLLNLPVHRQEHLALSAHLAHLQGDTAAAERLCAELGEDPQLLSHRDRVRHQLLYHRLRLATDPEEAIRRLRHLAEQTDASHHTDLAAEIWRVLATAALDRPGRTD
ncbi:helix-turn-helix domain-containing protein [Kitasatospora sp. NPDC096147]|uniref:helix-turn-helix domain-containing protein n=1 Tax=Kitasatospora sp. NPDC096147 TaxID=3364093 RepID=UPI00382BF390